MQMTHFQKKNMKKIQTTGKTGCDLDEYISNLSHDNPLPNSGSFICFDLYENHIQWFPSLWGK